jgi:cell wall-associated NlpC family hydrolase
VVIMPISTTLTVAGLAGLVLLPVLALASPGSSGTGCPAPPSAVDGARPWTRPGPQWDASQRRIASVIIAVGAAKGIHARGQVIAVATAMQESSLRNLPGGDADSIGVFQQRPSQGWGTPAQLRSVSYQASKFYDTLLAVPHWQILPITQAAQTVQRSAHPDAYARWAGPAATLVSQFEAAADSADATTVDGAVVDCPIPHLPLPIGATPSGGSSPGAAFAAVTWALAQIGTPYSYGGDCTAPHSTDATRHCDCSSLIQQAYRTAGVTLPRTTTEQVRTGTAVASLDQLRLGDLIFIPGSHGTIHAPDHVGLYIGSGLLVHAPTTGQAVQLAHVRGWQSHIVAVRRVNS